MKIVIHVGMHKTGSSSIQHTFERLSRSDLEYIDWNNGGNHSGLFVLLFEDPEKIAGYHSFRARGAKFIRGLPALREEWRARVSQQLARTGDKTVLFSAEAISLPSLGNATQRLHEYFAHWSNDISVIGYARPPEGFMPSAFQQYLKGGDAPDLFSGGVWPQYFARFERLDRIFGRDTVRLREFSPDRLLAGDVVQDFAHEIGLGPLQEDQIIRTNESLSREAVALLYVQRKLGRGFVAGFNGAHPANNTFISRLAAIGARKFAFSPQMLAPVLEKKRGDIAWMEDRLGHEFSEAGAAHPDAISSLDDLVDIALEQYDAVQDLLGDAAVKDGPATTDTLVRALERLREQCYAQVAGAKQAAQSIQQKGSLPMAIKTKMRPLNKDDGPTRVNLARIIWHMDNHETMPSDPEERKSAFESVSIDYQRKALRLQRHLENNNLMIVETEPQG